MLSGGIVLSTFSSFGIESNLESFSLPERTCEQWVDRGENPPGAPGQRTEAGLCGFGFR